MEGLIDTHAHIYLSQFQDDIRAVLEKSREVGINKIYMPNIDSSTIDGMLQLEKDHPDFCIPMMGIHPCYILRFMGRVICPPHEYVCLFVDELHI